MFEEQLKDLRQAYMSGLPEKIVEIESAWQSARENWSKERLRSLYRLLHSLSGSGATFGLPSVSIAARETELFLQGLLESNSEPSRDQIAQVDTLLLEVKRTARGHAEPAVPLFVSPKPLTVVAESGNRLVYLIVSDAALKASLAEQISPFGYVTRVFHDLASLDVPLSHEVPVAIILDTAQIEGDDQAAETLSKIRQARGEPLPLVAIAARGDMADRLQAARMGASAYVIKPVEISSLVATLDLLTAHKAPEPYRILIVEDDKELAEFNALTLQQAGMVTRIVSDPLQAMQALIDFGPGLILMDLYMPKVNGLELAAVIRQQEAFVSIPIVFLSAVRNPEIQLAAMRLGADDFLSKPIQPDHLVSSVSSRAQRYVSMRYYMTRDSLTGLLNHTSTGERLEVEIARARRAKSKLAYALIDLDHFKSVNDTHGHPVGDRVLKSLSRLLQQRFRKSDAIGRYGGEEFAIILPDTDGATAFRILDELRAAFVQIRHQSDGVEFTVSFSGGIAVFPPYGDAAQITDVADRMLYRAKNQGRNRIVLAE
jgi:diguanylate cyclase (GGDEF)-like protein